PGDLPADRRNDDRLGRVVQAPRRTAERGRLLGQLGLPTPAQRLAPVLAPRPRGGRGKQPRDVRPASDTGVRKMGLAAVRRTARFCEPQLTLVFGLLVKRPSKTRGRRSTPAGEHRAVMLDEVLAVLAPRPGEIAVDCTVGWAGHAAALLER